MAPPRSALYVPASNPRALGKAHALAADCVILDLEDAVSPAMKDAARDAAVAALGHGFPGKRVVMRVNARDTAWAVADMAAVRAARPDAVLIPKVARVSDAAAAVAAAGGVPVWLMIERPAAVLDIAALASVPGVSGLVAGWNDLALACGLTPSPDRRELWHAMSAMVLAGRARGAIVLDGVPLRLRDAEATLAEAQQARAFGFDGKTLVHPDQIAPCHQGFAPTDAEAEAARALLAAWEAREAGAGVIEHEGQMVEALHAEAARRLLARM